jgi:AcrR family transcriptional regulator
MPGFALYRRLACAAMSLTPWGESELLRERQLRPGRGVSPEAVELNQRERLYGATVAVVANKGYADSSVADLIAVAGVSRTTFYKYFADKQACFLATLEVIVAGVVAVTASRLRGEGAWEQRAERGVSGFIELLVAQPDAARLCMVEAYAAGPKAVALIEGAVADFTEMMSAVFEEMPAQRGMPPEIVAAMIGGIRKILHTRLHRRTEGELVEMVPKLVDLGLRYQPPPRKLPVGGRRRKKPSERTAVGLDEPAERIERATMAVVAREGYAEAAMRAIAAEAGVSLRTIYATYPDGKPEAFEAALARCRLRMVAATVPAFRRARSWPEAIVAITRASLAYFESEPDFARLLSVDIYSAGGQSLESRDRAIESTQQFIEAAPGYAELDNPVAAEAIQNGLYAMLSARVDAKPPRSLVEMAPLAIYMILAPFLGAEEAYAWAVGQAT